MVPAADDRYEVASVVLGLVDGVVKADCAVSVVAVEVLDDFRREKTEENEERDRDELDSDDREFLRKGLGGRM